MNYWSVVATKAFWLGASERAFRSFLQGLLMGLGALVALTQGGVIDPNTFLGLPWLTSLCTGAGMALFSVVTSLLSPEFVAGVQRQDPAPYEQQTLQGGGW